MRWIVIFLAGYAARPWIDRVADWLGARLLSIVKRLDKVHL